MFQKNNYIKIKDKIMKIIKIIIAACIEFKKSCTEVKKSCTEVKKSFSYIKSNCK